METLSLISGGIAGATTSGVNLLLLKRLAAVLCQHPIPRGKLIWLLAAKFGGLYPLMIGLLLSGWISLGAFVTTFTVVLGLFAWRMTALALRSTHA